MLSYDVNTGDGLRNQYDPQTYYHSLSASESVERREDRDIKSMKTQSVSLNVHGIHAYPWITGTELTSPAVRGKCQSANRTVTQCQWRGDSLRETSNHIPVQLGVTAQNKAQHMSVTSTDTKSELISPTSQANWTLAGCDLKTSDSTRHTFLRTFGRGTCAMQTRAIPVGALDNILVDCKSSSQSHLHSSCSANTYSSANAKLPRPYSSKISKCMATSSKCTITQAYRRTWYQAPQPWSCWVSCISQRLLLWILILGLYLSEPGGLQFRNVCNRSVHEYVKDSTLLGEFSGGMGRHQFRKIGASAFATAAQYRTDYVDESCLCSPITSQSSCDSDSFILDPITNGAGHVALSRRLEIPTQFSCKFTIVAPPHKSVQIVINNISIPETVGCKAGILRVFDGIPQQGGRELTRACGEKAPEKVVRSKKNIITLYYYQGAAILWEKKAFNVTYTYVHQHRPDSDQVCNETSEYLCANKLCISSTLKCDGYDNCGDRSEELMDVHVCGSKYNKSNPVVAVVIGSVVGVLLAVGLLAVFAYWARRRAGPLFTNAQLHRNEENGDGDESAADNHHPAVAIGGDTRVSPSGHVADLTAPDLTRDLIDRRRPGSSSHNDELGQPDLSPLDSLADVHDGPPPSYSSLFPDIV